MLPSLSALSVTNTPVEPKSLDTPLKNDDELAKIGKRLTNVPGDGSCFYHCIVGLVQNTPDVRADFPDITNADTARLRIANEFLEKIREDPSNYSTGEWRNYVKGDDFKQAARNYYYNILPETMGGKGEWAGDLEFDLASSLLQVTIHRFDQQDPKGQPVLVRSFVPPMPRTPRVQWQIVWTFGHFRYVRNVATPAATPAKPAHTLKDVRKLAQARNDREKAKAAPLSMNDVLRKAAQDREARAKGDYCLTPLDPSPKLAAQIKEAEERVAEARKEEEKANEELRLFWERAALEEEAYQEQMKFDEEQRARRAQRAA